MLGTDELWQAYNEQGEPTHKLTKDEARSGVLHGAAHIWIWHHDGRQIRVLLQVRAKDKPTWPGYLDISAAGHLNAGEQPLTAAIRETQEEIGLTINPVSFKFLFVHHQNIALLPSKIIENEFQWVYGVQLSPEEHFQLRDGEVDSLRWLTLNELKALAARDMKTSNLVPHGPVYFAELFRAIDLLHGL